MLSTVALFCLFLFAHVCASTWPDFISRFCSAHPVRFFYLEYTHVQALSVRGCLLTYSRLLPVATAPLTFADILSVGIAFSLYRVIHLGGSFIFSTFLLISVVLLKAKALSELQTPTLPFLKILCQIFLLCSLLFLPWAFSC